MIPFFLCISLIIVIWHEHYIFFFRYGLRNGKIIALNTLFLSLVLFYVYPLKFLTKLILVPIAYVLGDSSLQTELSGLISAKDIGDLMIIYGIGAAGIFFVLMLMYRHALKNAVELELTELEKFDARSKITTNLLMGLIPVLSVILSFIFRGHWLAGAIGGVTYFLYTPVMMVHEKIVDRKRGKLIDLQIPEKHNNQSED